MRAMRPKQLSRNFALFHFTPSRWLIVSAHRGRIFQPVPAKRSPEDAHNRNLGSWDFPLANKHRKFHGSTVGFSTVFDEPVGIAEVMDFCSISTAIYFERYTEKAWFHRSVSWQVQRRKLAVCRLLEFLYSQFWLSAISNGDLYSSSLVISLATGRHYMSYLFTSRPTGLETSFTPENGRFHHSDVCFIKYVQFWADENIQYAVIYFMI